MGVIGHNFYFVFDNLRNVCYFIDVAIQLERAMDSSHASAHSRHWLLQRVHSGPARCYPLFFVALCETISGILTDRIQERSGVFGPRL